MASKNIGTLSVDLRLQAQKFTDGMKRANAGINRMRGNVQRMTASFSRMGGGIAAIAGVGGMALLIKKSLETGDALGKMSDRLYISTENLAAMRHLTELSGESFEGLERSIERMARGIGEAQMGIGTAKRAFDQLGISVDDLKGKTADEQFFIIGEAIDGVGDASLRASYAADIFGRSGVKMLNTMRAGRDGFAAAKEEADKYGLSISRVDASKIEMANDAMKKAKDAVEGASQQLTVALAPIIATVAEKFENATAKGSNFGETVKQTILDSSGFIGVFADGIHGIKVIIQGVELALKGFGAAWANVMNYIVNDVIIPAANKAKDFLMSPIREILEFAAKYSDTAENMLNNMNESSIGRVKWLDDFAKQASDSFDEAKIDMQAKLMETIPSEGMKEKLNEIFSTAQEKAEEAIRKTSDIVKEGKDKVTTATKDGEEDPEETANKKKTAMERLANLEITNSKKVARIKQGIRLKEVIAEQGKAFMEAVASGPFPSNIPAIAFATVEAAAALSQVKNAGSFMGGGDTGPGARVGGTDGWGGMHATVHPNETVVDRTKAQGMGGTSIKYSPVFHGITEDAMYDVMQRGQRRFGRMVQQWQSKPI